MLIWRKSMGSHRCKLSIRIRAGMGRQMVDRRAWMSEAIVAASVP
jgi:hypothetical protein